MTSTTVRYWTQRVLAYLWFALTVPAIVWWSRSILFVIFVSLWANAVTHLGNAEAIRAQMRIEEAQEDSQ